MTEVDTSKPTKISCEYEYDQRKKAYEVRLTAKQDDLVIEDTGSITHYDFMSAKIFIDSFIDRFKHAQH